MYTFLSFSENEIRMDGFFDDRLENVRFFSADAGEPRPKHTGIVIEWPKYKLEEYLAGKAAQVIYRCLPGTGRREELFAGWENHGQLGNIIPLPDGRFFVSETVKNGSSIQYFTDKTGAQREKLWDDGFTYGVSLSPDGTTLAFHVTRVENAWNPAGCQYSINAYDIAAGKRTLVHCREGHLMFGTGWTPDGKYIVFQDCFCQKDPGHYFSDAVIARPDGSEVRYLTDNQSCYFGTAFGPENARTGGSNFPVAIASTKVLVSRCSPGAHPDARFCPERSDHREQVFAPECARGGAQLVCIDFGAGTETPVTAFEEGRWDFRPCLTPDGAHILYTTVRTASASEIHVIALDGTGETLVTGGWHGGNADHARWVKDV